MKSTHSTLLSQQFLSCQTSLLCSQDSLTFSNSSERIKFHHGLHVGQGIETTHLAYNLLLWSAEYLLDLLGFQQPWKIGVGHLRVGQSETLLFTSWCFVRSVQLVQPLECALGPDNETPDMTTGGQFEKIHFLDVHEIHSGNVAEGFFKTGILVVDDEGSFLLDASSVTHLTFAGPLSLTFDNL